MHQGDVRPRLEDEARADLFQEWRRLEGETRHGAQRSTSSTAPKRFVDDLAPPRKAGVEKPAGGIFRAVDLRATRVDGHGPFKRIAKRRRSQIQLLRERIELLARRLSVFRRLDGLIRIDARPTAGLLDPQIQIAGDAPLILSLDEAPVRGIIEQLVGRPEVFADVVGLSEDVREESHVLVPIADEVEDRHVARLAVPVEPAVALLEAGRIPRDVEVEEVACRALQVESLSGGVGGEEDTHGVAGIVEGLLDTVALRIVHPPEKTQDAIVIITLPEAMMEVIERRFVLGEDDKALVVT